MIKKTILLLLFCLVVNYLWAVPKPLLKPRVLILTDVSTWETDDSQSLVRLFAYADMFEIEGLVFTTGWSLSNTRTDFLNLIHQTIDAYEKDLPNLCKRSGQKFFNLDKVNQPIGYWPTATYLRNRVFTGSKNRGFKFIGADNDSDGSNQIIKLLDEKDDRPLWVLAWGGGNTLAQTIWRLKQDKSKFTTYFDKLRFYSITDQDRDQNTPFTVSSHQWLRSEFEGKFIHIWDEAAWSYQNGTGRNKWVDYELNIQNHGYLGVLYPKYKFGVEGDTPSFLYLLPNGFNNPDQPTWGSWGGFFSWSKTLDEQTMAYTNHKPLQAYQSSNKYAAYFYPAIFNDFAARMDWAKAGKGNLNPNISINGDMGNDAIIIDPKVGSVLKLNASKSTDPDGDQLSFKWWVLPEAGSYKENINLSNNEKNNINFVVPKDAASGEIHLICEVRDNGMPKLSAYRRIIIKPHD